MDKMSKMQVLPAIEVIRRNIDISGKDVSEENNITNMNGEIISELKPIKKEMIKDISNIYLGYFDLSRISKEQLLRVVWVIEIKDKTFIFNAITGLLIEEW